MERYYLKVGRRYQPVDIFAGWPADGVWFVRRKRSSATLITQIDDLHGLDLRKLGNLAQAHDIITDVLVETMNKGMSMSDRASKIIEALSRCDEWKNQGPF